MQEIQTEREVQAGIARDKPEGDGIPNASDSTGSQFQVARTEPDGTLSYHTLDALGITKIDLIGDATLIELPDGSVNTCQARAAGNLLRASCNEEAC